MYNPFIINWNTVPMTYNDSWTYLEMLGKCVTQIQINANKIEENRVAIQGHENRLKHLETEVIPAINERLDTIELNMVTKAELEEAIADATDEIKEWAEDNFLTSTDLQGYATEDWCEENFVASDTLDSYYTKDETDALLKDYVDSDTYNEQINAIITDINSIVLNQQTAGSAKYRAIDLTDSTQASISDNVATLTIPDSDYTAVVVNVSYTVQDASNTYTKNASVWAKRSTTGNDFVLYSMALGGALTVQDANGTITVTVAKPSGTEIITFTGAGVVVYTAAVEPSAAKKQEWFRKADANGDGKIDARDATIILSYYADLSTGQAEGGDAGFRAWCEVQVDSHGNPSPIVPADGQYIFPDPNLDGMCNSIDSTMVLGFYGNPLYPDADAEDWYKYLKASHVELN